MKALTFAYKIQNTYKEPLDLKDRALGWRFVLEDECTAGQVLSAIKVFMKTSKDMPVPADIYNIIHPPKAEITQAEYIAAKDWQKRNRYPVFSEALDTIKAFEAQQACKRSPKPMGIIEMRSKMKSLEVGRD